MDKKTRNPSKAHSSGSLPLGHEALEDQPRWSRSSSFSSTSNDSSLFCNSHPMQNSSFQVGKHLANDTTHPPKRKRNSSGSSVSSNMSCISDKDIKKPAVIISSNSIPQVVKSEMRNNVEGLSRLSCPEMGSNSFNLPHDTLLNDRLGCPETTNSVLPFRHNLRRNIRKKTCSCDCTATCTTFVVRRYKEISVKTVEEKTVISSTKVQTCVQNNATQAIHNVSFEESFSPNKTDHNRKRRSEVEKLYDSLHEIKWAKNFSPDNILRQLNIRQAASCSLFGRSSPDKPSSTSPKSSKKQKVNDNQSLSSTPSRNPSEKRRSSRMNRNRVTTNVTLRSRSKKDMESREAISSPNCVNKVKNSPIEQSNTTGSLEKRVASHPTIEKKRISILNCIGSPFQPSSTTATCRTLESCMPKKENGKCSVNLFSTSESTKSAPFNYLLNIKSESDGEMDNATITTDYPTTFYDIAEEGIRTIDACFREVGAEVVVSTCHETDCELPRLTSVKDSNLLDKRSPINETPPVLEPCISLQKRVCLHKLEHKVAPDFPDTSNCILEKVHCEVKPKELTYSREDSFSNSKQPKEECVNSFKRLHSNSVGRHSDNSLVKGTSRKISKKYLRLLRTKARATSSEGTNEPVLKKENFPVVLTSRTSDTSADLSKPLHSPVSHVSAVSPFFSYKPHNLTFKTPAENAKTTTILQTSNKVSYSSFPESIAFNQSTSDSVVYSSGQESFSRVTTSTKNVTNQSVFVQESTNFLHVQHAPIASTAYVPTKNETKEVRTLKEDVPRPCSVSFTCHYQTIKVSRQNSYTQVQLKLSRGCSIFLTVECLTELKDIFHRTGQDGHCHTLILNGIGDSFCLGLDLQPLLGPQKVNASTEIAVAVKEFVEALSDFKKPFVVVANGPAFGLGMTLLNHADICIASDTATFCLPQTSLGYFPEGGATLTLPQAVGSTMAMDLILRGRTLTAQEAKDIGLISEIMEARHLPYDLVSRVKVLAENSLSGMETAKAMLKMRLHLELQMVLENEVKLLPKMWLSKACQEALRNTSHTWLLAE